MKVEKQLIEFKEQTYRNAVRLFRDAALLYTHDSYPSSLAFAVIAYEEIGKLCVIDRGCDMMCMNPECANELYDMYFKGPWTTDHRHKQRQAFFDACARWPSQQAEVKTTKVTGKATVSGVTADVYSYADFLQSQGMKPAAALRKAKASIGGRNSTILRPLLLP